MNPRTASFAAGLLAGIAVLASGPLHAQADDKAALAGIKEVKVAFDVTEGDAKGLLNRINVIDAMAAGVKVVACETTMTNQKMKRDEMIDKIGYVKAGVVELMQKQREGWAYIRP